MIHLNSVPWKPSRHPVRRPRSRTSATTVRAPWSRRKVWKTVLASTMLATLSLIAIGLLSAAILMARLRPTLPTVAEIASFQPAGATTIYSRDGVPLARLETCNRRPVALKHIARPLIDATLAVEDDRFYAHGGVDFRGIGRALLSDLLGRDLTAQGASTITQQLARNVSRFGVSREKSLRRKIREALTAERIEQVFDKDTILEMYLNQIYYGSGAYGVEAAAQTYFGKSAAHLSLSEAALLAGLPQRPVAYSPYTNPDAARARRDLVLKRMVETGRLRLADAEGARNEPIRLVPRRTNHTIFRAPYFVDWVVQDLIARHGVDAVYSGWKVVTTLDWKMQEQAERAVRSGLSDGATQGALVCIDPHTGDVRAMVGGLDYGKDRFNAITQGKRQPGSAFKPIVYASAFDTGVVSLDSTILDARLQIGDGHRTWTVHNYSGDYANRQITVLDAITRSVNTVAVQVAQDTGIPTVIDYARRLGITTDLTPYPSLALGASAVRPIELCSAFGVFASEGERYRPTGVLSVTDALGRSIEEDHPEQRRVPLFLRASTVDEINAALRSAVTRGTGAAADRVPMAFGKTGTTSDRRDAWFVGYTPELVTAVWVADAYRDAHGITRYRPMPGATGGRVAAPIWARFMACAVPTQQRVNRLHDQREWAIELPPPPPKAIAEHVAPPPARSTAERNAMTAGRDAGYSGEVDSQPAADIEGTVPAVAEQAPASAAAPAGRVVPAYAEAHGDRSAMVPAALQSAPRGRHIVSICVETGKLATEWCPATLLIDVTGRPMPTQYCRLHHAPAGEPSQGPR